MADARNQTSADGPELVERQAQPTAVVRGVVPVAELRGFFDRSFGLLGAALADGRFEASGPAFALYRSPPGDVAELEVGFPTAATVEARGDVVGGTLPGGRVARTVHAGAFDDLGAAWGHLQAWIEEQGLRPSAPLWEVYLTEPSPDMDPSDLRTELLWPVTG